MKECSKIFIVGLCMFLAGYLWGQKSAHTADILKIVSTTVPDTKSPRKLGSKINRTLDECDEHNLLVLGTCAYMYVCMYMCICVGR